MSDSRIIKKTIVNFHPTSSNTISGLNGAYFDGSTLNRPIFYYPCNEALSENRTAGQSSTITDESGNSNNGLIYNPTGSAAGSPENPTGRHNETPWGPRLNKGIHKYSFHLGVMSSSKNTPGWSTTYDRGDYNPYIVAPTSLTTTSSNGTVETKTTPSIFGDQYTVMVWIRPAPKLFENAKKDRDIMGIFALRNQEALVYRWDDGRLAWEVNAASGGQNYDWQMRTKEKDIFKADKWYHVCLSRDVSNRRPPRVYINGKQQEMEHSPGWTHIDGKNIPDAAAATNVYFGRYPYPYFNADSGADEDPTTGQYTMQKNFVGNVTQFIGWSKQLEDRDIYTIFGTSLTGFKRKSGFLDLIPYRERIYIEDNRTGSYPTIVRSGIDNRLGKSKVHFDDRNTIIFKKHKDIFPGELDKIKKGFTVDDILGWWRFQELFRRADENNWTGRFKVASPTAAGDYLQVNEVSELMNSYVNGAATFNNYTFNPTGSRGYDSLQTLSDSGPNAITGNMRGDATFTTDRSLPYTHIATASRGPFPQASEDSLKLMSANQKSRWGGQKAIYFPQTGSFASYAEFTDASPPRMRLIRPLRNGSFRDKGWTMSMWVNIQDKGLHLTDAASSNSDTHGFFRIESHSGSIAYARLSRSRTDPFGRWNMKFTVKGLDPDTNENAAATITTLQLSPKGKVLDTPGTGSIAGFYDFIQPNRGLPIGWHHFAFVYRGGISRQSDAHWKGTTGISTAWPSTVTGGRMQIWMDGHQLITSATLTNIDSFKRIRDSGANIAHGKKIVFGHYYNSAWIANSSLSLTGAFSGSMAECALIAKPLKKRGINRILRNGLFAPSINVASFPHMINRHHPSMDREPTTDITTYGSTVPGISDKRVTFTQLGDELQPFNDRKTIVYTGSNIVTTPADVYPGLDQPLGSKASFSVNITPQTDQHLLKFSTTGHTMQSGQYSEVLTDGLHAGRNLTRALARNQASLTHVHTSGFPKYTAAAIAALPGLLSLGGQIPFGDYTGFTYFNFNSGKWEQVGLYDPSSGHRIPFDYATSPMSGSTAIASGTVTWMSSTFPQQFKPGSYTRNDLTSAKSHAFHTTGRPTVAAMAPYATKYHATSSQTLKLSKYITEPFLLERVVVELPVNAYCTFGGDALQNHTDSMYPGATVAGIYYAKTGRIMHRQVHREDNLVFFLYRQTMPAAPKTNPPRVVHQTTGTIVTPTIPGSAYGSDSISNYTHPALVSGSQRYLICSGVACFYNDTFMARDSVVETVAAQTSSNYPHAWQPQHTPSWKHNWGIRSTTSSLEYTQMVLSGTAHGSYTGSIVLNMVPAVQGPTSLGASMVFGGNRSFARTHGGPGATAKGGPNSKLTQNDPGLDRSYMFHHWVGGTAWKDMFNIRDTGKQSQLGANGRDAYVGNDTDDHKTTRALTNYINGNNDFFNSTTDCIDIDSRTIRGGSELADINGSGTPVWNSLGQDDKTIREHPYLLMPGDELVFGIDYLPTIHTYAQQENEISGSYVKLLSSGSATVTFYGSFLREGKPQSPTLNQNLTSLAVHEVIGNDPVRDQFMTHNRQSYTGSYIDNLMRGWKGGVRGIDHGYTAGSRRLIFSGNQTSKFRWRQSIVGSDSLKVFSTQRFFHLTSSIWGRKSRSIVSGTATWQQWTNTPHGGPVWGVKHASTDDGSASSKHVRYIKSIISGSQTAYHGPSNISDESSDLVSIQSTTASYGGSPFYYSCAGVAGSDKMGGVNTDDNSWHPEQANGMGLSTLTNNPCMLVKPIAASLLRGVRLVTQNERYYDSLMPHLGQWAKSHKGVVVMGQNHKDTAGLRRYAISLPGQTSICRSGSFTTYSKDHHPLQTLDGGTNVDSRYQYTPAGDEYDNWQQSGHKGSVFIAGQQWQISPLLRRYCTGYEPNSSKGQTFQIEPTNRARFGISNSATAYNGVAAGHYQAGADHYCQRDAKNHAENSSTSINSAAYSGSLSFPYEMSPRRIARDQRCMLTVYTGTDVYGADVGSGQVQPNMYMYRPQQIRYALFRLGASHSHSRFNYSTPNFSDHNSKVRVPNQSGSWGVDPRGQHGYMLYFPRRADNENQDAISGMIHLKSSGHTTGTYGVYTKSSKHSSAGGAAEGFRYGLINTEPMNTSAVFRHDTYGQFRDMLEQRQFTRFFKRNTPFQGRRRSTRNRRRTNSFVSQGPVSIRFKSTITGRRIKSVNTYSQNLSPTSTSSLPYFDENRDGKFRNRPFPFDDSILDSAVITEEDVD